ncbi:uncharacterized protein CEXT_815281 [Caerostris extrusa]|uniref:Uncharacterized protein n=1 Tax=Caerostris extrusa TaxID=172846 RepID=A0AAV4Y6Y6_CAEEX|nr:uncharacterized protein CEXT_815281 [Caerostris extrusa]
MQEKCCCGCCFLSTGTAVVLLICSIQALIGILWNSELLMLLNKDETISPLHILIDSEVIEDFDVVHGLVLAAIGLNAFWLVFAIIAARGNVTLKRSQLVLWDKLTYLIFLFDLGTTIYFAVKMQGALTENYFELFTNSRPTKILTYMVLMIAFSKGGLMFFNVYLAYIVQLRGKEIDQDQSSLAMYILTHLAQCRTMNENALYQTELPPPYATSSPYYVPIPPTNTEDRSGSEGSQWSLSYDAIQGMSNDPPKYVPPPAKRNYSSSIAFVRALTRDSASNCETATVDTDTSPILPY